MRNRRATPIVEHMSDQSPTASRPGQPPRHRDLPGRITGWQQDKTGRWWAEVEVRVPAGAVQRVAGEDYTQVPRAPAEPQFVLAADSRTRPPTAELHLATCWLIAQPAAWRRVTPLPDADQARAQLKIPGTLVCTVCRPEP
jgi:hypothetical protein